MEEVALRVDIQIRNHTNRPIVDVHDRKLRRAAVRAQSRIVQRPVGLGDIAERASVGIEVGHERDEPVLHDGGERSVVDN